MLPVAFGMAKKRMPERPRDMNQLAKRIVDLSVGEVEEEDTDPTFEEERAAKGGRTRAERLTAEERSAIAQRAAQVRWSRDDRDTTGAPPATGETRP